jgi:hypothetical protein
MERLIVGNLSPLPGGLLAARAGKVRAEIKRAVTAKKTKMLFIL